MAKFLALALVAMLWPQPAQAGPVPSGWATKALALAQSEWHPACGQMALAFADPASALVVDDAPSRAGQVVPPDQVLGFTAPGSCSLGISSRIDWRHLGFPVFCNTVLHEGGRAAGRSGTDGPGVMATAVMPSRDISRFWRHGRWHRRTIWSGVSRRCVRPMDRR